MIFDYPLNEMTEMDASKHPPVNQDGYGEKKQRLIKQHRLAESGYQPFGSAFSITGRLSEIRTNFREDHVVRAAGRLITIRHMGKSVFADLRDGSGRFQVYAGKAHMDDKAFDAFKLLDSGDIIGVEGDLFVTRTGEQTIRIQKWTLLTKALRPLPEKWHGLKDVEIRYRQRYLDLISNPEARGFFDKRIRIIREIRSFLWDHGFDEVETPMMQSMPGGAIAKPFRTHYTALSTDMFLRIAPELYLKRLLVGGFDKIFELNRNFRNEGISKTHNPEFTMLEVYQAYSDMRGMKALVEGLITTVAQNVFSTLQVGSENNRVDLSSPWREVAYRDLILEKMGSDWFELSVAIARERASALGLTIDTDWNHPQITHEIYEKTIERQLEQPTIVTRLPRELVPLAKVCDDDPTVVDVFELVIGGKEIAPGYSELIDPIEQRKRFQESSLQGSSTQEAPLLAGTSPDSSPQGGSSLAGLSSGSGKAGRRAQASRLPGPADAENQQIDEDFLIALEHGMPPTGGMGIGIDRLIMVLTGADAIRDVILFPQLRVKSDDGKR